MRCSLIEQSRRRASWWRAMRDAFDRADLGEALAPGPMAASLDPDFTIDRAARSTIAFKYDEDAENCFDAMRKAGLPER
jgi:hypothetical protein